MGSRVSLDTLAIEQAINGLKSSAHQIGATKALLQHSGIEAFSTVSGFRGVGQKFGHISSFNSAEAFEVLADHLLDAANVSATNLANAKTMDSSLGGRLGEIDGRPIQGPVPFEQSRLQQATVVNASATDIFKPRPNVGPQMSLPVLAQKLFASNLGAVAAESAHWAGVSTKLAGVINALYPVKHSLGTSLDTTWVQLADSRVNKIQRAAGQYLGHANQMAAHVQGLGTVTGAEQIEAAALLNAYTAASALPLVQKSIEAPYLAIFPTKTSAALQVTVPMFAKLLPDLADVPGDPFNIAEISSPTSPEFDRSPRPQVIQEALANAGHRDLAYAETPGEVIAAYGTPNPDMIEAISAGATKTQAASIAAPSMPPSLTPGLSAVTGAFSGGASTGAAPGGAVPGLGAMASAPGAGASAVRGGAAAAPGPLAGGGVQPAGAAGSAQGTSASGVGVGPSAHRGALGTAGSVPNGGLHAGSIPRGGFSTPLAGAGGTFGAGAAGGSFGGGMGFPFGGAAGAAGASMLGGGAAAGATPGAGQLGNGRDLAGNAGAGAHAAGQAGQQNRAVALGGAPVGAGAGANRGEGKRSSKVKAVTSAVEREGNLRALLGQAPLVLPTVIGSNVRD